MCDFFSLFVDIWSVFDLVMLQNPSIPGLKYNSTLVHAVVLYIGMRAIEALRAKGMGITMTTVPHTSYMDVYQNLAVALCAEGEFLKWY